MSTLAILLVSSASTQALDLDGDGMSDVWQRVHNIATGDTASDIDGDSQSNATEAATGTNPRDPTDSFQTFNFAISPATDSVTLSWRSVEKRYYEIDESTDLITWGVAGNKTGQSGTLSSTTLNTRNPVNDLFSNRRSTSTSTTQTTGSNVDATTELGEPINPSVAGRNTVWWSWSSYTSGPVTITTAGSDFDTTLAVYSGAALSNLVLLAANDDAGGRQSAVTFTALAGVSYSIQVNSYSTAGGLIVLNHPISSGILPSPSITSSNPPKMFFRVRNLPQFDTDSDRDSLTTWEERLLGSNPASADSDADMLPDGWEFIHQLNPSSATDAAGDVDADGLNNLWEFNLGLNPRLTDSNNNGINDPLEDQDQDGLTNISELSTHLTLPDQPDTDDDGLSDGWEILYGYFARVNNETDADQANDPDDDPDNDGLLNSTEDQIGTNPNSADTDGDGFSDPIENEAASSATNPASTPGNPGGTPGGPAAPPPPTIPVQVNFGDHSVSHSEKYKITLEPLEGDANTQKRHRTNRKYGQTQTETFNLPAGAKYKITISHVGTDPEYDIDPNPDFDYTLKITSNSTDSAIKAITEDNAGILGVHDESEQFFAENKSATLYVAWMTSETVATQPQDRKRERLGVGEEVNLTLKPASLPSPAWKVTGTTGTSKLDPLAGITSMLTAGELICTPSTEATILGELVKIDFDVIEPTGVTMDREQGTGVWHIQGIPSAGFKGRPFITPIDVSFIKIEIREGQCAGLGTGFYGYQNGLNHPDGAWVGIISGSGNNPSQVNGFDTIRSGADGAAVPAIGSFDWPIPWLFRVAGGGEKQFAIVTHHHESDAAGSVTISKGGVSVSASINDPTAP